jgi:hypothetical protein
MPMGLYEFGLGLWLLIKGIQAPPPPEVAPSAADSPVIERRSIPR